MDNPSGLVAEAKRIYRTEGLLQLVRRGVAFLLWRVFEYRRYYLYADPIDHLRDLSEADFLPRIDGFTVKVVSSNEEADELEASGLQFRAQFPTARRSLDSGAVAFCLFVGDTLAHIGWAAFTREGQKSIGEPPYVVDFSNREACSGGSWTHPEYRRLRLRRYSRFMMLRHLLDRGIRTKRAVIARGNIPPQQGRHEYPRGPQGEGRYLRVLWWKSWKERPLSPQELQTAGEEHG
jgi:hypothetical protein